MGGWNSDYWDDDFFDKHRNDYSTGRRTGGNRKDDNSFKSAIGYMIRCMYYGWAIGTILVSLISCGKN